MRIRIRIQQLKLMRIHADPAPDTDPDPKPCSVAFKMPAKNKFFLGFFFAYLLLFVCTFTSVFKNKKLYRSHQTVKIKVFLTILCFMMKESIQIMTGLDPGAPELQILWIWIWIRIHNTDTVLYALLP